MRDFLPFLLPFFAVPEITAIYPPTHFKSCATVRQQRCMLYLDDRHEIYFTNKPVIFLRSTQHLQIYSCTTIVANSVDATS